MKKLLAVMSVIIVVLLVSTTAVVVLFQFDREPTAADSEATSIDDVIDRSWGTQELTTNLEGEEHVRASFRVQADSTNTREEVEKRDFQIKNAIIYRLSETNAEDLGSAEGLRTLEDGLRQDINELLHEGEVEDIYTTSRIIQ